MANKPTDPQIKIKCDLCDGQGETMATAYYAGAHREMVTLCKECDDGAIPVMFDAGTLCFYGDSSHSEWGTPDNAQDMAHQLECCYDAEERAKLTAWFAGNAAHCTEIAADARKELCSKAADEAEQILAQLHKLFAHMIDSRMPCRHLSTGVAAITMAIPDIRSDGRNRTATEADRIFVALNVD